MKKAVIFIFIMAVSLLLLVSCSSEKKSGDINSDSAVKTEKSLNAAAESDAAADVNLGAEAATRNFGKIIEKISVSRRANLPVPVQPPVTHNGMNLVWSDGFDGTTLDSGNWVHEYGYIRNNEPQWYSDQNTIVQNGYLTIEARDEGTSAAHRWTSGSINTKGLHSWKGAYFEMRARMPKGKDVWPAFWTMGDTKVGWPYCGEIDIVEYYGQKPADVNTTVHFADWNNEPNSTYITPAKATDSGTLSSSFHTFGMLQSNTAISFYYDGRGIGAATIESYMAELKDYPQFILLNLALQGSKSGGTLSYSQSFPADFNVDYVAVYQ